MNETISVLIAVASPFVGGFIDANTTGRPGIGWFIFLAGILQFIYFCS